VHQCGAWRLLPWASFFMHRRAMRSSSEYTCSVSRTKAASSPLPQAFNKNVISSVRGSMVWPVLSVGFKKYTRTVAAFGSPLPPVPVEGEQTVEMISFANGGNL
jgi:hypothetical protein